MCLLVKYGGLYLDTDTITLRSLAPLPATTLGFERTAEPAWYELNVSCDFILTVV